MTISRQLPLAVAQQARSRLRGVAERLVDRELLQAERVRRALLREPVDVLMLTDSTGVLWSPEDVDKTPLPGLVSRTMGGARVASICSPGLGAEWFTEVLRVLGTLEARPAVVVHTICVRTWTQTHVRRHPVFARAGSLRALQERDDARRPMWPVRRRDDRTDEGAYAAFEALEVETRWAGRTTIGECRARLKGLPDHPWSEDLERLLWDYFHGQSAAHSPVYLEQAAALGRELNRYGVPAVGLVAELARGRGEEVFPGEFSDWYDAQQRHVVSAVRDVADDLEVVRPAILDDEFVDRFDGTEHYALAGRLRAARAVAAAVDTIRAR